MSICAYPRYKYILYHLIYGHITNDILISFCKLNVLFYNNKKGRSFPRNSKTPFTKWYVKGYSNQSKYRKIVHAIINGKIDKLNKNLKTDAKKIILINGKKYP